MANNNFKKQRGRYSAKEGGIHIEGMKKIQNQKESQKTEELST